MTSFVGEFHRWREGIVRGEKLTSRIAAGGKEDVSLLQHLADQPVILLLTGVSLRSRQLALLFHVVGHVGSIIGAFIELVHGDLAGDEKFAEFHVPQSLSLPCIFSFGLRSLLSTISYMP